MATTPTQAAPLLETGMRLTREEFERRCDAMPDLRRAELIEGIVYMASALRHRQHGRPHSRLVHWIETFADATPGVDVGDNSSLRLDGKSEPQADALLRLPQSLGGQSSVDEEGYSNGGPELVAEVRPSS